MQFVRVAAVRAEDPMMVAAFVAMQVGRRVWSATGLKVVDIARGILAKLTLMVVSDWTQGAI